MKYNTKTNIAYIKTNIPKDRLEQFEEEIRADERAKVLEEIKTGTYAKEKGKCPICYDCPKNCPLEKEQK